MAKKIEYEIKFDYETKTITKITTTIQEIELSNVDVKPKLHKEIEDKHKGKIISSFYGFYGFNYYFMKTEGGIKLVKNDDWKTLGCSTKNFSEKGMNSIILGKCFSEDEWTSRHANLPVELINMPKDMIWRDEKAEERLKRDKALPKLDAVKPETPNFSEDL